MKLWQKLYVVLIIPILLILNIAIYLLFGITYKENIAAEKKQAVGTAAFVGNGFCNIVIRYMSNYLARFFGK